MIELSQEWVDNVIPSRNPEADKNTFGRIVCICGSAGYTGAAYFSAQGAVRMGSGIVTLAAPRMVWTTLAVKLNAPVVRPLPCTEDGFFSLDALPQLLKLAERADALLIGCGLGQSPELAQFVCTLLEKVKTQIVLDADGINAIIPHKDILQRTARPVILTPHAREFFRLSDIETPSPVQLTNFAQKNHCILLYKRHRTLIAAPDGQIYRNHSGNPGMAKGGSGDILAGMLTSLCGQGIEPVKAACAAAYLHGRAGDIAANRYGEYSMTPDDLLSCLPDVLKRYNTKEW